MVISLQDVGLAYRSHWVFDGLYASFSSAAIHLIVGANGSGKSSLVALLAGLRHPSRGIIHHSQAPAWHNIAVASPEMELPEGLQVRELLWLSSKKKSNTDHWLADSQLAAVGKQLALELSSGMRQRLMLAMAWSKEASLLLLDEPFNHLDPNNCAWCLRHIKEASQGGSNIIIFHHEKPNTWLYDHATKRLLLKKNGLVPF